jgi:hypothetical protein
MPHWLGIWWVPIEDGSNRDDRVHSLYVQIMGDYSQLAPEQLKLYQERRWSAEFKLSV